MDYYNFDRYITPEYLSRLNKNDDAVMGVFDPLNFVVALKRSVLENINSPKKRETLAAQGTLFHETVHWWQIIGTTSGLMHASVVPLQYDVLTEMLRDDRASNALLKKPILESAWKGKENAESVSNEGMKLQTVQVADLIQFTVSDTYLQLEFAQRLLEDSRAILGLEKAVNKANESRQISGKMMSRWEEAALLLNHSFINNLGRIPGVHRKKLPQLPQLDADLPPSRLELLNCNIGYHSITEAQARYCELQLLFHFDSELDFDQLKSLGYLGSEYTYAFDMFIRLSGIEYPSTPLSFAVHLFLLICDISLMPEVGYPKDLKNPLTYLGDLHPGCRFVKCCKAVGQLKNIDMLQELLDEPYLASYEQYEALSLQICEHVGFKTPIETSGKILDIYEGLETTKSTMAIPFRFLIGRHIDYLRYKMDHLETSCWPLTSFLKNRESNYIKHGPPFVTDVSKSQASTIIPYQGPDIADLDDNYFHFFFAAQIAHDLFRQLMSKPGPFSFNYRWLPDKVLSGGILELGIEMLESRLDHDINSIVIY